MTDIERLLGLILQNENEINVGRTKSGQQVVLHRPFRGTKLSRIRVGAKWNYGSSETTPDLAEQVIKILEDENL